MWKIKIFFFCKNCCQEGRKTRIFVHTICFGQKMFWAQNSVNHKKTIKILVSAEIGQNQKWHLFLEKGVFWHGWKSGFYELCFWKAVFFFSENTFFIVFSAKPSFSKTKTVWWKKQKIYENSGLFLNMAKRCFLGFVFLGVLMLLCFVFVCLP